MDNLAIARVLGEIGDLLEIKNENPFKIRAYRNAADTIAHFAEPVASLTPADRLRLPGVGKDLAAKIGELVDRGTCEFHQELLQEFPPTVLDLLRLQGVGPKTVALLYRSLEIKSLDDLERAARDGRIRELKGMGARKETLILKALEDRQRFTGRRLMPEAYDTAATLVAELRSHAPDSGRVTSSAACDADVRRAETWTFSPPEPSPRSWRRSPAIGSCSAFSHAATPNPASFSGTAFRRTCGWCRATALAPRSSTSPARRLTTSRCAIVRSSEVSN